MINKKINGKNIFNVANEPVRLDNFYKRLTELLNLRKLA